MPTHCELTWAEVWAGLRLEQLVSICGCRCSGWLLPVAAAAAAAGTVAAPRGHKPASPFMSSSADTLWESDWVDSEALPERPSAWISWQPGLSLTQLWPGSSGSWLWCWPLSWSGSSSSAATVGTRAPRPLWRGTWQVGGPWTPTPTPSVGVWRPVIGLQ